MTLDKVAEAVAPAQRAAQLNPLPEFQWVLADTLRAAGRADEAAKVEADLKQFGAQSDPRTFALFLATRGEQAESAVQLAQRELQDRADIFTHDALAWALAAAGRHDEAWPHMEKALAEGTVDARLFTHAGVLAARLGRTAEAESWLASARKSTAHAAPLRTSTTRCNAGRLGDVARHSIHQSRRNTNDFRSRKPIRGSLNHRQKQRSERPMKTNLTTLTAAFALATALPNAAQASSHMDAPLITRDPSANTTDVYAFVDQDNASAPDAASRGTPPPAPPKSLVVALAVYPHEEPGVGPNIYNFDDDVLYEIHIATGRDVAAGRATISYQFRFKTTFRNQNTILDSYLGVINERRRSTQSEPPSDVYGHQGHLAFQDRTGHGNRSAEQSGHRYALLQSG